MIKGIYENLQLESYFMLKDWMLCSVFKEEDKDVL